LRLAHLDPLPAALPIYRGNLRSGRGSRAATRAPATRGGWRQGAGQGVVVRGTGPAATYAAANGPAPSNRPAVPPVPGPRTPAGVSAPTLTHRQSAPAP